MLLLALVALLWYAPQVFLLAFAAVLLAVFLQALAALLARYSPFGYRLSLAIVVLVLLGSATIMGVLIGPNFATQFSRLIDLIPSAFANIRDTLQQYPWAQELLARAPDVTPGVERMLGRVTGLFSALAGALTAAVVVLVSGLYLAIHPTLYVNGLIKLVPRLHRDRACQILEAEGRALRRWLAGRFISMLMIGILTTLGLWIANIPLALSLGVLAGLLSFIPYLGPITSFVPALLVALLQGAGAVLWAALVYGIVQIVESYLVTPLVESRAVSLPPALIIVLQVLMGTLLGLIGVLVATPLAVVFIVLIQTLYVQDVLGDDITPLGQ